MFRLSRICLAANGSSGQCLYKVLGVAPNASTEEIKGAFRQQAKATHPDTAAPRSAYAHDGFREMVEAYRVLRDPRKRAEYDRQRGRERGSSVHQQHGGGGHEMGNQWPRGDGLGMSEEFRANLYGYDAPGRSGQQEAQVQMAPASLKSEYAAVGLVLISGLWFLTGGKSALSGHNEPDPYPSRRPVRQHGQSVNLMASSSSSSRESSRTTTSAAASAESSSTTTATSAPDVSEAMQRANEQDELVRAYWNPFAEKWQRIPDGYEAPASMDLTAWHKKRADPAEWSRLFAEGTLSNIIPRGGLRERYRPVWDTYEPTLIMDPITGKTVQMSENLPTRNPKAVCDVQF